MIKLYQSFLILSSTISKEIESIPSAAPTLPSRWEATVRAGGGAPRALLYLMALPIYLL